MAIIKLYYRQVWNKAAGISGTSSLKEFLIFLGKQ